MSVMPSIIESVNDFGNQFKKYVKTINHQTHIEYDTSYIRNNYECSNKLFNLLTNRIKNNSNIYENVTNIISLDDKSIILSYYISNCLKINLLTDYENYCSEKDRILIICDVLKEDELSSLIEKLEKKGTTISGICSLVESTNNFLQYKNICLIKFDVNEFINFEDKKNIDDNLTTPLDKNNELSGNDKITILSAPTMDNFIKKMSKINKDIFIYSRIDWEKKIIEENLFNKNILFIGDLFDFNFNLDQLYIIKLISQYKTKSFTICFPYFPSESTAIVNVKNYKNNINYLNNNKILATFLSELSYTKTGKCNLILYDLNDNLQEYYFGNNINLNILNNNASFIETFKDQNIILAFASENIYNKYTNSFPNHIQLVFVNGEFINKNNLDIKKPDRVLIIDNGVDKINLMMKTLKESQISAYVEHANFRNDSYLEFLSGGNKEGLFRFYASDSINQNLPEPFFQTISVIPNITNDVINICGDDFVNSNKFIVHLADINATKKKCLINSLKKAGLTGAGIRCHNITMGDDDGSINENIYKIAIKRFDKIRDFGTEIDYHLSIENGLIEKNNKKYNVSCIIINRGAASPKIFWSDCIEIPKELLDDPNVETISMEEICGKTNEQMITDKLTSIFLEA